MLQLCGDLAICVINTVWPYFDTHWSCWVPTTSWSLLFSIPANPRFYMIAPVLGSSRELGCSRRSIFHQWTALTERLSLHWTLPFDLALSFIVTLTLVCFFPIVILQAHSFIQNIFIEHLLYTRFFIRHWVFSSKQDQLGLCLQEAYYLVGETDN